MDITFSDSKLEKLVSSDKKLVQTFGALQAKKIKVRLDNLRAASTLEDVRHLPGKFHELTSNRKGQWACHLDEPYRLIFIPHENPIPTDSNGNYIWAEIVGVEIVEIVDYHKK